MKAVEPGYVALAIQKACHRLLFSWSRGREKAIGEMRRGKGGNTRKYPENSFADKSNRCWPMPVVVMTHIAMLPIITDTYRRNQQGRVRVQLST